MLGKSNDIFGYCENPAIIFWKRTKGRNIKFWEHFFGRIEKVSQPLSPRRLVILLVTGFKKKYPVLCARIIRFPFQKEPCPAQNTQEGCWEPTVLVPVSTVHCGQTWPTGHPCPCSREEQCTRDQASPCFFTVSAGTGKMARQWEQSVSFQTPSRGSKRYKSMKVLGAEGIWSKSAITDLGIDRREGLPAVKLKLLPFCEAWTGENQFSTDPTTGICRNTPCKI